MSHLNILLLKQHVDKMQIREVRRRQGRAGENGRNLEFSADPVLSP